MPARKHREGTELEEWLARRARHKQDLALAKMTVHALSGHSLLRPREVAEMLGITTKTLREMEARGELPPRVKLTPQIFGWRLKDIEALIDQRMVGNSEAA